ncbi:MAG: ice-binding family protein [Gaiellaceae bacterium]
MKSFSYSLGGVRSRTITALLLLTSVIALTFVASGSGRTTAQQTVDLGNATSFGALDATAMTNAGAATVVKGDIGSGTSIDLGVTNPGYASYVPPAGAVQYGAAQASLGTAFLFAQGATPNQPTITGANLAGMTLVPGVYNSTGAILIDAGLIVGAPPLTLNGGGDPNSVFIFQAAAAGDLTVNPTSNVLYTNGAQPCHVFWKVRSAFLKNTGNTFVGTIMASTQITLTDNITVQGRVLAQGADVTFIHDVVNVPACAAQAPPPAPTRVLYCDPHPNANGWTQSYELEKGQDKLPPYAKLGLIPAYVDPITGAESCNFPLTAPTPTPTPTPTPPTPTPPTPTPPTPTPPVPAPPVATPPVPTPTPAPKPTQKPASKPTTKGVAAATRTYAKPAKHHAAFTG